MSWRPSGTLIISTDPPERLGDGIDSACFSLWYTSQPTPHHLQNSIERALAGYQFYPEAEWGKFDVRPPDSLPLLGAWRHPGLNSFVFVLDATSSKSQANSRQAHLYITGPATEIDRCATRVRALKDEVARLERRGLRSQAARDSLGSDANRRSIQQFLGLGAVFTVLVNAVWLFLSKVPIETGIGKVLFEFIKCIALAALGAFALLAFIFVIISGFLIIKRQLDA